jgi:hypothetical protein
MQQQMQLPTFKYGLVVPALLTLARLVKSLRTSGWQIRPGLSLTLMLN